MEYSNTFHGKKNFIEIDDNNSLDLYVVKNEYSSDDIFISMLLPTRARTEYLDSFLKSLLENTSCINNIEIIIYIDSDDAASQKYENIDLNITKLIGPKLTMGQYNSVCYRHCVGNIVMLVNDDLVIETKNWDNILKSRLNEFPDDVFLAFPNDGINKSNLCSFPILSRKTCDVLVHPFPSLYKRLFIDTHIMDVFIRLNRHEKQRVIYLDEIKFTHLNLNPHVYDSDSLQRTNDDDDVAFVLLRNLRSSQYRRLRSIVNNEQLPAIVNEYENIDRNMSYYCFLKWFLFQFICDKDLPVYYRIKYLIKFSGHFFMIKTSPGLFLSRSISVFKREMKFTY